MKDRIAKLIETEGLSPSLFADKLGINRPTVSHVLSGRNYPGYEFLQKILRAFPKLSPDWLLLGEGSMYRKREQAPHVVAEIPIPTVVPEMRPPEPVAHQAPEIPALDNIEENSKLIEQYDVPLTPVAPPPATPAIASILMPETKPTPQFNAQEGDKNDPPTGNSNKTPTTQPKEVEQIVIFYSDRSFKAYHSL